MQAGQPVRPISLLLSHVPTWLYDRLRAEAERRQVPAARIVQSALERELMLGGTCNGGEPDDGQERG